MLKRSVLLLCLLLVTALLMSPGALAAQSGSDLSDPYYYVSNADAVITNDIRTDSYCRARVVKVLLDEHDTIEGDGYTLSSHEQTLLVELKNGEFKGRMAKVTYDISDNWSGSNEPDPAKPGDMVIVCVKQATDGELYGYVAQFGRQNALIWMGAIFLVLLIFFGGKKGLRSIIALLITCVCMICVLMPLLLKGLNPVLGACAAGIVSIALTLIIVYGFSIESLSAALGAFGGVLVAGVLVAIMNKVMNMSGFVDEESMYLAQSVPDIDLRGMLFAAILISVLGGTIDVSISISSALKELKDKAAEGIKGAELMASGINIGVDIMGASLNTLILAYVGGSIHLLMLFYTYDIPFVMLINDEMIAAELLRAFVGSFGLLLTVPITSFVSAMLLSKGDFGRFSLDCFGSVVVMKKAARKLLSGWARVSKRFDELNNPNMRKEREKEEEKPDDLYAMASKKSAELGDEYFSREDE